MLEQTNLRDVGRNSARRPSRGCVNVLMSTVVACVTLSAVSPGPSMALPQIEAAIQAGQSGKEDRLFSRCLATAGFLDRAMIGVDVYPEVEHFHVSLTLTPGRIATLAAAARRLYRPFLPADVPEELKTLAVFVEASPHEPASAAQYVTPPIEHLVLKSKNGVVAQPDQLKIQRAESAGIGSGESQPNKVSARFPVGRVRELPAGEFDIVLITKAGERKCKVGDSDRNRLFGGR